MKGNTLMIIGSVVFGIGMGAMHGLWAYVVVGIGGYLWGWGIAKCRAGR